MLYSTFINQLRAQVGDIKKVVHVDWTGDGATTVFQMPDDSYPVLDDATTYDVRVNSVVQVENTDYTLDKVTGTINFVSTPGNGIAVSIDSIRVYLRDSDWMDVINSTIYSLGDDFWKEFVDETLTTTANMTSLSLTSSQPQCIAVYEFAHKQASTDNWKPVETYTNWRYDRDNNIIYLAGRDTFTNTGELLKVRGLKKYIIGDETTDTIDVQDRFFTILEYGCIGRYWRWRYKSVVELVSKMATESSRSPLQELIMLSDRFDRLYEIEKSKLKPAKPARIIPTVNVFGGRP